MDDAMAKMPEPAPASPPYDGRGEGRKLLRTIRAGSLATIDKSSGHPMATLITVATDVDGSPLLLTSLLSGHTRNLESDPRCSILLARTGKGDPLAHPRLTVVGTAARSTEPRVRSRFLRRHPKATLYADFPDFSFWRIEMAAGHLNGGFARAAQLTGEDLRTSLEGAQELVASEEGAVTHMNADHADALRSYATHLAGEADGAWRASGLDPEGLDLICGDVTARVEYPRRVSRGGELRLVLKQMADAARAEAP